MSDAKYWIALEQVEGIGPAHLRSLQGVLQEHDLSILDIFDLTPAEIRSEFSISDTLIKGITSARESMPAIENDYLSLLDAGIETLLFFEDGYPERLIGNLQNSIPPILYCLGNTGILQERGAAILGDRYISEKGNLIAHLAAREFSRRGIPVISGLARGAELTAHFSALESNGKTIAIVPFGMMHLKIPELLREVFDPGRAVIISPFYPTREFSVYNAYNRNRIICALSYAVYIVESPAEGGIFEAGKSAQKVSVPLFVTEYAEYPESAEGNKTLLDEFDAQPVRGRMENNLLAPNLDSLIGIVKFSD